VLDTAALVAFVPTTDPARARAFYEGRLGLTVTAADDFALVLDANGTTVRVTSVPELTPHPFTVLGWRVPDVAAAVAALEAAGVAFEHFDGLDQDEDAIWDAPGGARIAWFLDPDGNVLSLQQDP
jgi:catechol 2,3-dioxygenase-like lactoylglutathione lyase family enzyme